MLQIPSVAGRCLLALATIVLLGERAAAGLTGEVAAGRYHSCAAATDGFVYCWGQNLQGQLGDGTNEDRVSPHAVVGVSGGVLSLASGRDHTCAVTSDGEALCWGENNGGQLGDATLVDRHAPVTVTGLESGVLAIAAGQFHSCALTASGGVLCWGYNSRGQLGDGTNTPSNVPVPVSGLSSGVAAIAMGQEHGCALTGAGDVWCWGNGSWGQLGNGNDEPFYSSNVPVPVTGLAGVDSIAAGDFHSCAAIGANVFCWGRNYTGQLGNGETADEEREPVLVAGTFAPPIELAGGRAFTCARGGDGLVQCWGIDGWGQLGVGTAAAYSTTPVYVSGGLAGVESIAAGQDHVCAATSQGDGYCWGRNLEGQLGTGTGSFRSVPGGVATLTGDVQGVGSGTSHSCAVTAGGGAVCWGFNPRGQLGDGTTENRTEPVEVQGLSSGVQAVAGGEGHSCAMMNTGEVLCWGSNNHGQLGDDTFVDRSAPVTVSGLTAVVAIALGSLHSCALRSTGELLCWGWNNGGQLGDGTYTDRPTPTPVASSESFAAVAAGTLHTCAVTTGNAAQCWGEGGLGQLGDGGTSGSSVPVQVSGLTSGVEAVAAGYDFSCARLTSGGAMCWGKNGLGQLGDGTFSDRLLPVAVSGISDAVAIDAGSQHACALGASGSGSCWGAGDFGALGNGATTGSNLPQPVSNLWDGAALALGSGHGCVLTASGGVLCWGTNSEGQLGDGWEDSSLEPVLVLPEPSFLLGLASALATLALLTRLRGRHLSQARQCPERDRRGATPGPAPSLPVPAPAARCRAGTSARPRP